MEGIITLVALGMALSLGFHWGGFLGAVCGLAVLVYVQKTCKHYLNLFLDGWDRGNTVFGNGKPYIPPPEPPRQVFTPALVPTHGSARFATYAEAVYKKLVPQTPGQFNGGIYLNTHIEPSPNSLFEKWTGTRTKTLFYGGNQNILTIAPPRNGKAVSALIPTLLTCSDSVFVLDPKGENLFVTLPARVEMGQEVVMINPFNIYGKELDAPGTMTSHNNPLDKLRPEQPDFTDKIQSLAAAMIIIDPNDHNKYFSERARSLVTCLMAHLCFDEKELKARNNNLPYMRHVIGWDEVTLAVYIGAAYRNNPHPLVRDNAGSFFTPFKDDKTGVESSLPSDQLKEFRSSALAQLEFLTNPGIQDFLSCSDFDFADLRRQPTSIYLMMSFENLATHYRFARLMIQCLFNAVIAEPQPDDRNILVLLDEQNSLGNMDVLQKAISAFPGYGIRVWSVFQDANQMADTYGEKAWRSFISSAGIIQVMTPNDSKTADEFSERAGDCTLKRTYRGESTKTNPFGAPQQGGGEQVGEDNIKMRLLSAPDLYGMPDLDAGEDARILLFCKGLKFPFVTARDPYYGDQPNQAGYFRGMPYAPNPMQRGHEQAAYEWMKNYLHNTVQQDRKDYES
jgi:type IV secretory pathway TraG/TraD family ATPase VirD4